MAKEMYADMHMHTIYSDGSLSPRQVVAESALLGMNLIAVTDHDITTGYYEAEKEARRWGLNLITGVEFSCKKHHILGYNFDINNKEFQEVLAYSRACQDETTRIRVRLLKDAGVPLTFEKIKAYFPNSRVGKCNIITTMMLDNECRAFNGSQSSHELFYKYVGEGGIAYKIDHPEYMPENLAIQTIHNAGGIAVVAHPFKDVKDVSELELLAGIDGVEIQPNYNGQNEPFREYAKQKGLLITYGSDYHGGVLLHRPLLRRNGNVIKDSLLQLLTCQKSGTQ